MVYDLELKLSGLEPVTRKELITLVNSWGRLDSFDTTDDFMIMSSEASECYPLENLDVSQIEDMSDIFCFSNYNGDLSKWNLSNCKNLDYIFNHTQFNNDSISHWNVSNVTSMTYIFSFSNFNCKSLNWDISNVKYLNCAFFSCPFDGDISFWNFNKDISCFDFALKNNNFQNKYNNGNDIPSHTPFFLDWFEENREKMKDINQGTKEEVFDFFSFNETKNLSDS